jgi:CelD/BcsL family acetyltransferase involved in cellulose biosynthesis
MPLKRRASTAPTKVARMRPSSVRLLQALIRDQCARGRTALDLGVGEARYKASVCDETRLTGSTASTRPMVSSQTLAL